MGNHQSASGLEREGTDEEGLYQSDEPLTPTEDETKQAIQESKEPVHLPSNLLPSPRKDAAVSTSHTASSYHFTPKHTASTQTDSLIPEHPPSYINLLKSHPYTPLSVDDIYLEEETGCFVDDNVTSEPIVVEPDDKEFDYLSSSRDTFDLSSSQDSSNLLLYQWSRNNIQVTDLIDELIQNALVDDKGVTPGLNDGETPVDAEPLKKKKSKVTKKSKAKTSKSVDSNVQLSSSLDARRKDVATCLHDIIGQVGEGKSDDLKNEPLAWEIDCTDFAAPKRKPKKAGAPKKTYKSKASKWMIPREGAEGYVPPEVKATAEQLTQRKMLDQRRWLCISRPQYSKSCGLSSLIGCWNYLFSTLGCGNHQPITQEQALTVLGFKPPFAEIRFGPFTGNATLMRWFEQLNNHYGVRGRTYFLYKPHGSNRTLGRSSDEALQLLKKGLQDETKTFIYHCWNHYFCPIGYEDVPLKAADAYRGDLTQEEVESWILVGESSRKHPGMHCFKWSDISTDLNCQMPQCLNIRKLNLGVQTRKTKKVGGNLHCIMVFQRNQWQGINALRESNMKKSGKETIRGKRKKGSKKAKPSAQAGGNMELNGKESARGANLGGDVDNVNARFGSESVDEYMNGINMVKLENERYMKCGDYNSDDEESEGDVEEEDEEGEE